MRLLPRLPRPSKRNSKSKGRCGNESCAIPEPAWNNQLKIEESPMASNKGAIVTGAGTGIGKSAALALLKDGYCVALVGRRKELLEKNAADSGAADRTLVIAADLAKPEGIPPVFAATKSKWGRLDVLFNNAGMGA